MESQKGVPDEGSFGPESAADQLLRYRTLTRLEAVLRQLVNRYGSRVTLGEMLAIYAGMARLCKQDRVTIAEIADATGLSKQNLSRWAQKRLGDSIYFKVNEEDGRVLDVFMLDRNQAQEHIEQLAVLLGTDKDG